MSISAVSNFLDYQKAVNELKFQSVKCSMNSGWVNNSVKNDYVLSADFDKPVVLELDLDFASDSENFVDADLRSRFDSSELD